MPLARPLVLTLTLAAALALCPVPAAAQPVRIDVTPDGLPADGPSTDAIVSFDGRYVAFWSSATNLVAGLSPNTRNLYRYDRQTGTLSRATMRPRRFEELARTTAISYDGRLVLFSSFDEDFVDGDTNDTEDVFQYDFATGATRRISVTSTGQEADHGGFGDSMSADGRYVVFSSRATNLGPPEIAPASPYDQNVFVHDTLLHQTHQVTAGSGRTPLDGSAINARISPDGDWVVFTTHASNLAGAPPRRSAHYDELYLVRWQTGAVLPVGPPTGTGSYVGTPNWDAAQVLFATVPAYVVRGGTDRGQGLFVWDRVTGIIDDATPGHALFEMSEPVLSSHGRYVTRVQEDAQRRLVLVHHDRVAHRTTVLTDQPSPDPAPMSLDGRWVAFSTRAAVYLQDMPVTPDGLLPTGDADGDGMLNGFEERFGLSAITATGDDGPSGDPDHDGRSNAEELAAGTHPRGFHVRLLAEGASNAFFHTRIALLNTGAGTAFVWLRFLLDGGEVATWPLTLPPGAHRMVDPVTLGVAGRSFSTVVESDQPVVVTRTMAWDEQEYGAHAESAVAAPSTTWYLAEGSTAGAFALFYLLQNPQAVAVDATVTFVRPAGLAPVVRTYTLPAGSRTTIAVDAADASLASTDVSAVITAAQPIVVERAMYLDSPGQPFTAGLGSAGVTAPSTRWILAEGATGPFFDTFILMLNPGDTSAECEVRYATTTGGRYLKAYTLAPHSRTTIWMDAETIPGAGNVLRNVAAATTVTVTNGVPIVVERTMWWPDGAWYEAHGSPGATGTAHRWAAAGLEVGVDARAAEPYLLILNTGATAGTVLVTLLPDEGWPLTKAFVVPAAARLTIPLRTAMPLVQLFTRPFGAVVEAVGSDPIPIVVEQAQYWNAGGVVWAAGTGSLATPLP